MHVEKQTNVFFILGYCRDFYFFIYFFTRKTVPFLSGCFFFYGALISTVYRCVFNRVFFILGYCSYFYFFIYCFTRKTVPFLSVCFFFYRAIISTVYRRLFNRLFIISDYQKNPSL